MNDKEKYEKAIELLRASTRENPVYVFAWDGNTSDSVITRYRRILLGVEQGCCIGIPDYQITEYQNYGVFRIEKWEHYELILPKTKRLKTARELFEDGICAVQDCDGIQAVCVNENHVLFINNGREVDVKGLVFNCSGYYTFDDRKTLKSFEVEE